jgi:D-alanyl-lipoteichoic acid acyltransferase DltB (MBOAT superfamily)
MTFNSFEFLIFYPLVILLYFALPKKLKWPVLLLASYYFYIFYQPDLVFLIFGTTLVSWVASNVIAKTKSRGTKRFCLAITLIVCLGVLFLYKYANFILDSVGSVASYFGMEAPKIVLDLVLPVGISFYTFQTLSYVIDVYRGEVKPERNFFFYALFVSFFPQLVAGPIERTGNLIPQLKEAHKWDKDNALKGAKHMIVGFFKKICVADLLSVYVNSVYNDVDSATGYSVIIATVLFAIQIYCDFSGYTDIATGAARVMGIRLMKNFDHPYMATTIKEFWSRWHISLSGWFKDYLYIPLGGSRCKKPRHLMNLMIVFLVSGLWHGAAWTYVIWGAIHGIYQVIGNLTIKPRNRLLDKLKIGHKNPAVSWIRRGINFVLVCFAWLFFRANSVTDAFDLISAVLYSDYSLGIAPSLESMGLDLVAILMCIFSVLTLIIIDKLTLWSDEPDGSAILVKHAGFVYFLWVIMFAWAILLSKDVVGTFIYFQF